MADTGAADAGGRAAWAAALDALEVSLDDAARVMGGEGAMGGVVSTGSTNDTGSTSDTGSTNEGGWVAPAGLGVLPAELAARARDLLNNQHKLICELEQARNLTLKHLTAVRSVPPERDARASVYLDVAG